MFTEVLFNCTIYVYKCWTCVKRYQVNKSRLSVSSYSWRGKNATFLSAKVTGADFILRVHANIFHRKMFDVNWRIQGRLLIAFNLTGNLIVFSLDTSCSWIDGATGCCMESVEIQDPDVILSIWWQLLCIHKRRFGTVKVNVIQPVKRWKWNTPILLLHWTEIKT